jgi:hypothetical protein
MLYKELTYLYLVCENLIYLYTIHAELPHLHIRITGVLDSVHRPISDCHTPSSESFRFCLHI